MLVHWKMTSVLSCYRHMSKSVWLCLIFFLALSHPTPHHPFTWIDENFGWNSEFLRYRRVLTVHKIAKNFEVRQNFSLERRWSSRTFRYGYLVTTSPQSSTPPSTAAPLRLAHRLRVLSTLMVWRAVCTRPGNVFTAACWSAITSNSNFM